MSSIQYVIGALHKPLNDHYNFYWRILEKSGPEKVSKGGGEIFSVTITVIQLLQDKKPDLLYPFFEDPCTSPTNIYLFKVNNKNTKKGVKYVQS